MYCSKMVPLAMSYCSSPRAVTGWTKWGVYDIR